MMGYDYYGYRAGPEHGWDIAIMVFVWVVIIAVIISMVKWVRCHGGRCRYHGSCRSHCGIGMGDDDAIKILKERFARGEIDEREFEERKKVLMGDI